MKIRRGLPRCRDTGRVLTLGVFDGIHRGHARLLSALKRQGQRLGLPAAVITFTDHPHGTLRPSQRPPRLATLGQCLGRMQALGMDEVFVVPFTESLAHTPAQTFIADVLVRRLRVRHVVVGKDFVFGRAGAGNVDLLRAQGRSLGFGVTVVPALQQQGRVISSSGLRRLVAAGQVAKARQWLGWAYTLHGVVKPGAGRGLRIGLATANMHTVHEIVPSPGTYAVCVKLAGRSWPALCNIGRCPTFHNWGPETIEVHIPGWRGSLYGRRLEVGFIQRLRQERRFGNAGELVLQVRRDWERAKSAGWLKCRE